MSLDRGILWFLLVVCAFNMIVCLTSGQYGKALDDIMISLLCYRLVTGRLPE
jgi:hypothetical protein